MHHLLFKSNQLSSVSSSMTPARCAWYSSSRTRDALSSRRNCACARSKSFVRPARKSFRSFTIFIIGAKASRRRRFRASILARRSSRCRTLMGRKGAFASPNAMDDSNSAAKEDATEEEAIDDDGDGQSPRHSIVGL